MNENFASAQHQAPHRLWKRLWMPVVIVGVALGGVLIFIVVDQRVPLSVDEKQLVGRWYGLLDGLDQLSQATLIEEFGADRTIVVTLRSFSRERTDLPWESAPVGRGDWKKGTWRLRAGVLEWRLINPDKPSDLWHRLVTLVRERRWQSDGPDQVNFTVVSVSAAEKELSLISVPTQMRSVRVPDDFVAPDEPLAPDTVLEWWERKRVEEAGR